jgi:acyl carrier protein
MDSVSLKAVIAKVLNTDPDTLTEESGMNETDGWDSLHQFLIMTAIERSFAVKLEFSDIENVTNLGEIRALLERIGAGVSD